MKARFRFVFAAAMPLAFATYTQAQTFNNSTADGLTWGDAGNWTPATVPNASGAEAILDGAGPSGTAPASLALDVLLDGNYTIGKFTRSVTGGQPATFPTTPVSGDATKGLTLQKSSGQPEINVAGDVFFYSAIFGTQGFEKTGAGRFTLRFNGMNQTYSDPVKISAGTLGIEKDRSLGDVGNSIEIANGARLFAEPGSTAGTITLPATRSIILGGAFPQIGSADQSVGTLTVGGDLDISASPAFVILDDAAGDASLVPGGTELVLIDYQGGSLTGTFAGIADGATVSVTKGTVTNDFLIDYNDPDHGGKAVTLTSSNAASGNNFASWANDPAKGNIPGEPATGDFDNDGLTNIVEYALGKDPRVSSQPAGDLSGDKITFTKGLDAIANRDVSWVIETSTTLAAGSWTPVVTQPAGDGTSTISYTFTPGTPVKNFARLSVTQVP